MSEQRIRELLDEVAGPVPAPNLADQAWQRARRSRRRLVVAGAAVAAAVLVIGFGVLPPLRGGQEEPQPAKAPLAGRTFVAVSVTEGGKPAELPNREVSLAFTRDGKIRAKLGCGEISTGISAERGRLETTGERTESSCSAVDPQPEWPRTLLNAGPAYHLVGNTLTLTAGRTTAVYRDLGHSPLGRTFVSTYLSKNGQALDILVDTQARLAFTRAGELRADVGCNQRTGTVDLRGGRIRVQLGESTVMYCGDVRTQETWLRQFLDAGPAWRLDGATLTLTSGTTHLVLVDAVVADPSAQPTR